MKTTEGYHLGLELCHCSLVIKTSPFGCIILTANRLTSIKRLTARIIRVALLPEMRSGGGTFAELIWDMDAELRIVGGWSLARISLPLDSSQSAAVIAASRDSSQLSTPFFHFITIITHTPIVFTA